MDTQRSSELLETYRGMETDELVDIYRKGTLTDEASSAMQEVFHERNISPENIEVINKELSDVNNERLASLGNRFAAQFVDVFVALGVAGVFIFLGAFTTEGLYVVGIISYLLYLFLCDALPNGQSLGKKMAKIRVVSKKSGMPCSTFQSFIRNGSLLVLGIIDILFILGQSRRRLGDHAAGTEVINIATRASASSALQGDGSTVS